MNIFQKLATAARLNKIRKTMNLTKLNKSELWIAVFSSTLIAILTQLEIDPALAEKVTLSIAGIAASYIAGRSVAKAGQDQS